MVTLLAENAAWYYQDLATASTIGRGTAERVALVSDEPWSEKKRFAINWCIHAEVLPFVLQTNSFIKGELIKAAFAGFNARLAELRAVMLAPEGSMS